MAKHKDPAEHRRVVDAEIRRFTAEYDRRIEHAERLLADLKKAKTSGLARLGQERDAIR